MGSAQTNGVPLDQAAPSIHFAHVGAAIEILATGIACRPCALPLALYADIDRADLPSIPTVRTALPLAVQLDRLNGVALVLGKVLAGIVRPAAGGLSAGERERVRIASGVFHPGWLKSRVPRWVWTVHARQLATNGLAGIRSLAIVIALADSPWICAPLALSHKHVAAGPPGG